MVTKFPAGRLPAAAPPAARTALPARSRESGSRHRPRSPLFGLGVKFPGPRGRGVPRTPGAGPRAGTSRRGQRAAGLEGRGVGGGLVNFAASPSRSSTGCLCVPGGGGERAARQPRSPGRRCAGRARRAAGELQRAGERDALGRGPASTNSAAGLRAVGSGGGAASGE